MIDRLPCDRHFGMAAGLGSNGAPLTAMAVLEPQLTASGALEVVLATEDGNVLGEKVFRKKCPRVQISPVVNPYRETDRER